MKINQVKKLMFLGRLFQNRQLTGSKVFRLE